MKICPHCKSEIKTPRVKYCTSHCKYWYNLIKKQKESHLPPVRKRNDSYFFMVTGSTRAKSGVRQGKRVNGMITGSMSAMINVTVEEIVPVTAENLDRHFAGIPGYMPTYARLGNDDRLSKEEAYKLALQKH